MTRDYLKSMNKSTFILGVLCLIVTGLFGQSYKIKVKIKGYNNDTLLLGYQFGDKQYIKDTAYSKNGEFTFKRDTVLEPGMYLVVTQPTHDYFQMLVDADKQDFSVETDIENLAFHLKYKGSKLNTDFNDYIEYIASKRLEGDSLNGLIKHTEDTARIRVLEKALKDLDKSVKSKQNEIIKTQPKSLLSLLILWSQDVDIPAFEGKTQDEKDEKAYYYYKDHYFDFAKFDDERSVRLPLFSQKVDRYLTKMISQIPDSINKGIDLILSKAPEKSETYKYLLSNYLNYYANSKYVGMDAVYVHLVEAYYAAGKAPWVDAENLAKMTQDARALKPLLIDKIAPDLRVFKEDSSVIRLHEVKSPYTIVLIWSPECGHCKQSMPAVVKFYEEYKSKGVEIFGICSLIGTEESKCWEGVKTLHMDKWINTSDKLHLSRFKTVYDVKSTPQVYILDAEKRILTKKISPDQLGEVMDKIFKIKENEQKQK